MLKFSPLFFLIGSIIGGIINSDNSKKATDNNPTELSIDCSNYLRIPNSNNYAAIGNLDIPENQNIEGIINTYTPVLGFIPCENKITVEDATTFNAGDTVLMIQMKGAVVDSSNTASFGTITDYKSAGNYEFNYVKSKTGNVIELLNNLTRTYEIPEGKVQLIRVPFYDNATVTVALTCLAWDGNKGGVLVINAKNDVQLDADINVSGKGFSGGPGVNTNPSGFNCSQNQFYYPPNGDLAVSKGEGITTISSEKSYGKGKLASGGGGGNSHNSGGGGGSNASGGGTGGYQLEPSSFSPCNGSATDNRGLPGMALNYDNTSNKIYLGGAGGAGHVNNPENFKAFGGNGGGIIIIQANSLTGNSKHIIAKGNGGLECTLSGVSACHEGMGGGGAGGTVLINTSQVNGSLTVDISGGKGGDMVAPAVYTRVGPGGGGSGGIYWFSSNSNPAGINVIANGGTNGICTQTSNSPWGASPGEMGLSLSNLTIPVDSVLFVSPCTVPVTLSSFSVTVPGNNYLQLSWHTEEEIGIKNYVIERATSANGKFISIGTVKANNRSTGNEYDFTDFTAQKNTKYYYRLKIVELSGTIKYSEIKNAIIKTSTLLVNVYPNPAAKLFTVQIVNSTEQSLISLYNNLGQLLKKRKIVEAGNSFSEFDISKLAPGIYLLKVITGKQIIIKKIEKQK